MMSFQTLKQKRLGWARILFLVFSISLSFSLNAQTSEQAQSFLNRSHVAIMKVQKEMMKSSQKTYAPELKEAIKYQSVAVKYYDQNKIKDAINYSYKSRSIILTVLNNLAPQAVAGLSFNEEEKKISMGSENEKLQVGSLLSKTEEEQINQLDVLDYQKLRTIVLNPKSKADE